MTAEGRTIALLTLTQADIRPIGGREVLHVRELPKFDDIVVQNNRAEMNLHNQGGGVTWHSYS